MVIGLVVTTADAGEQPSATDLAAQVWQYLTTEDGEQARAVLATILQ
ncbi:MAG: hypothetical protein H8K06_09005, partial [Nitrospira sp.]|nr:hypothetical protein [Nitrospira sp.]